MKIGLIAFDGFTDLDLILHWDLLNRVRLYGLAPNWEVKILGTKPSHISVSGLEIPTSGSLKEAVDCDGVLVCSGMGTRKLLGNREFLEQLNLDPSRQFLAAQCSGSLILGELGLLKQRPVSAYPPILENLRKYGAELVSKALVESDSIATASSCLAGASLSDWLIRRLAGQEAAEKIADSIQPLPWARASK